MQSRGTEKLNEALDRLRSGPRVPFGRIADIASFRRGVYAWWATRDSPRPLKAIDPIKAGDCFRVGGKGVIEGRNANDRLAKNIEFIIPCLTCNAESYRWYTVFATRDDAERWCRTSLEVAVWNCPDEWRPRANGAIERAVEIALDPWYKKWQRLAPQRNLKIGRYKESWGPWCPKCREPVWLEVRSETNTPRRVLPCERCGG